MDKEKMTNQQKEVLKMIIKFSEAKWTEFLSFSRSECNTELSMNQIDIVLEEFKKELK